MNKYFSFCGSFEVEEITGWDKPLIEVDRVEYSGGCITIYQDEDGVRIFREITWFDYHGETETQVSWYRILERTSLAAVPFNEACYND